MNIEHCHYHHRQNHNNYHLLITSTLHFIIMITATTRGMWHFFNQLTSSHFSSNSEEDSSRTRYCQLIFLDVNRILSLSRLESGWGVESNIAGTAWLFVDPALILFIMTLPLRVEFFPKVMQVTKPQWKMIWYLADIIYNRFWLSTKIFVISRELFQLVSKLHELYFSSKLHLSYTSLSKFKCKLKATYSIDLWHHCALISPFEWPCKDIVHFDRHWCAQNPDARDARLNLCWLHMRGGNHFSYRCCWIHQMHTTTRGTFVPWPSTFHVDIMDAVIYEEGHPMCKSPWHRKEMH